MSSLEEKKIQNEEKRSYCRAMDQVNASAELVERVKGMKSAKNAGESVIPGTRFRSRSRYAAAVVLIAIMVVTGSVIYADGLHYMETKHWKGGLYTGENVPPGGTETEEYPEADTGSEEETDGTLRIYTSYELVSSEVGEETDAWLTKEVYKECYQSYQIRADYVREQGSDEGFEELYAQLPELTGATVIYTYADYRTACEDLGWLPLFDRNLETENVGYREFREGTVITSRELSAGFVYGENGRIVLYQQESGQETMVSLGADDVRNPRDYVSVSGEKFALYDTDFFTEENETWTLIRNEQCFYMLSFRNMSEEEIYEILDAVR